MKIFITGATGFIGSQISLKLAENGNQVHALFRSEDKTSIIHHPNIKLFKGNILDYESLRSPLIGCSQIYHTAALTNVWAKDPSLIYRNNIEGALNVIRAGIKAGVKRIVCTSTVGVLGHSEIGGIVDENSLRPDKYYVDYEYSKAILEEIIKVLALTGPEIVIVNPSRVYGPRLLSESNWVTRMIFLYIQGKWRIIPGNGNIIGNYVYVDDVVSGHILAMEKGKTGERYVLGGSNITYNEFFKELSKLTGKKSLMIHIPKNLLILISGIIKLFAIISGRKPVITPSLVRKYLHHWNISSQKAEKELIYSPIDYKIGLKNTIEWLINMK
jgi:nucleoside-diphosphate-sugar epimerase